MLITGKFKLELLYFYGVYFIMRKLNIGIVGTGLIASLMAETLIKMKNDTIKCVAVASRCLEKAEMFAKKYDIKSYYGSYEDMIRDKYIDLIYIAVPHSEHYYIAKLCIEAKKNVLCEKPITVNAREARALVFLSKKNKVFIAEAIWTRYMPSRQIIDNIINSGIIGEIHSIQANLGYPLKHIKRMISPNLAGGALLDLGVYTINFALMVFGNDIKEISSKAIMSDNGIDFMDSITISWNDGKLAVLHATMLTATDRKGLIFGDKGYISVTNINNPEEINIYDYNHNLIEEVHIPKQVTGYEYEIMACQRAINNNNLECIDMLHRDSIFVMEILDTIREQWDLKYPFE